jgi:hypothetical protein
VTEKKNKIGRILPLSLYTHITGGITRTQSEIQKRKRRVGWPLLAGQPFFLV